MRLSTGVDLQLTATAESYREVLVVKTAQAAASPEPEKISLTAAGDGAHRHHLRGRALAGT
ncbi:hypothetical protein J7I98_35050 [Streptomyces sp. ISL-98]|uniref:hypothetical protein n=1 Tax=Streptomyces sp. ISL-98 TaxID=2819192 RepID=UPI001BE69592|nr:hypothetical protein [Streptomyces sp. ISL-98]MBT2510948.1 hypothetical protein [Streptomyces sp. ISL-98]